jgi:prevent-host-death family protein
MPSRVYSLDAFTADRLTSANEQRPPGLPPTPVRCARTVHMKTMDASRVRGEFAGVLDTVRDGQPVVIVRYGRPLAALVPLSRLKSSELRALTQPAARSSRPADRTPARSR